MKKKIILFISILLVISAILILLIIKNNKNNSSKTSSKVWEQDEEITTYNDEIDVKDISKEEKVSKKDDSKEFMEKYFEDSKKIQKNNNKENVLIIISKKEPKNVYGATDIIKAPNNQYILQYNTKAEKTKALQEYKKDDSITAEENIVHKTLGNYNSWGIEKTGLDYAVNTANTKNLNEVTVAIIDTGLDLNVFNQKFSNKILGTYNVLEQNTEITDETGHGTHVAGTIAEGTPNNVKIFPIKVSKTDDMYTSDIIEAINYITYNEIADVINMSYGGYNYSYAEYSAIEAANKKHIVCVAAAGNDNKSREHFPSSFDNTISISSVDSNLDKSSFSNFGDTITFSAPGEEIRSINGIKSGTSMATPHVSSAVAILKSYNDTITLNDTINILKKYAIDLGDDGWDKYYGYGFINFKGTQFTDGENTDQYGIFKNTVISNIEAVDFEPTQFNYGNITNLMNAKIIIYDELGFTTKSLWELDDLQIIGYQPYSYTDQNVTLKYQDRDIILKVNNKNAMDNGWSYYKLDDNTIYLWKFNYSFTERVYPHKVYIPSKIDGYTVKELAMNLFSREKIKSLTIENGVEQIDGNLDLGEELEELVLPSSLKKILGGAFQNCKRLRSVNIPNSVEEIYQAAFQNTGLKSIVIPNKIQNIRDNLFKNCSYLKEVTLPEELTEIGKHAFENTKLSDIYIPKNVNNLGVNPFFKVETLKNINIDVENETYTNYNNCNIIVEKSTNRLISANSHSKLPSTIKIIGQEAFSGDMSEISLWEGLEEIEDYAFNGLDIDTINKIVLPKSLTKISDNAFKMYNGQYVIPENLTLWVYKDSYSETYAKQNNISFRNIDPVNIEASISKTNYKAFEKVDTSGIYLLLTYDDDSQEYIRDNITVKYIDNRDSFRFGDTYIILSGYSKNGEYIEKQVAVNVSKAIPTFNIPQNINAIEKQKLSEISLPNGFEWMNGETIIDGMGNKTYKAKFIPQDQNNYNIVEDININIYVKSNIKTIVSDNISIEYNSTTYNGKNKQPNVNIIINNVSLSKDRDFKVEYKNNKNIGTASIIVTGIGNYNGKVTKTFTINPKGTSLSKLTAGKKKFTAKWKKQTIQTTGYQIQYSTDKNFKKDNKTSTISKNKTLSKAISKLKSKKKYYVRVRTYKTVKGKKYYSGWSSNKSIKTK